MSKNELLAKIELLNEYEAMLEELKAEADEISASVEKLQRLLGGVEL